MKKLSEIVAAVKDYPVKRVAVAAAADLTVLVPHFTNNATM